jgi:alpha-tubulin suppressor-like RCC1 family protein
MAFARNLSRNLALGTRPWLRAVVSALIITYLGYTQLFVQGVGSAHVSAGPSSASESASALALGSDFTCAINSANTLNCWGSNRRWQLTEQNVTIESQTPVPVSLGAGNPTASRVAAGDHHACAITGGALKCWGASFYGQIGNNPPIVLGTQTYQVGVEYWGRSYGEITTTAFAPTTIDVGGTPSDVTAGDYHTCVIVGGGVRCWGRNHNGQVGNNSLRNQATPAVVAGISGATRVHAGDDHTCALVTGGAVSCWGGNN